MPALIPSGPKLPSFQKLKSKKRARPQVAEEPKHAPKTKKPTTVALPKNGDSNDSEVKAEKPRKAQKKNAWNKRMAEERRERIEKRDTPATAPARPARTKAAPGSNWEQLKSTMTHSRNPKHANNNKMETDLPRGDLADQTSAQAAKKAQKPAGWNTSNTAETDVVGIDCEMVGVGDGATRHSLARVVIVNYYGGVLLDRFVKQMEPVTDYRTAVSGIRASDLKGASDMAKVQKEVYAILKDKIIVGHQLSSDLKVLMLDHPKLYIRDTARYAPLLKAPGKPHSLKHLAKEILDMTIQEDAHNPVEDAQIPLLVYRHIQKNWESSIKASVKNPASINPITKLVEKTNRAALSSPKTNAASSSKATAKAAESDNEDSWASSQSEDESGSDQDSDSGSGSDDSDSDSDSE